MRILYSWAHGDEWKPVVEAEIALWREAGFDITGLDHRKLAGIDRVLKPDELDRLYRQRHAGLMKLYRTVEKLADEYDVLLVHYDTVYHPEFLASLRGRIYTALCSGDDPDSSEYCSKPYVAHFDHIFAWGVRFDETTTVTQKFLEWGAKRADWWPYGARSDACDPTLTEQDIYRHRRSVPLAYVGTCWGKSDRLLRLKKHFGSRFRVHGKWGRLFPLKHGLWVKPLPAERLVPLYCDTRIGINIHLTYGPCNMRVFELPANGVMQVCDCADGLGEVFEVGKEVVAYRSMDEAIDKIEYYLAHDVERIEIALNGLRRVRKDYTRLATFARAVEKMRAGMRIDGIELKNHALAAAVR
jgi:spore maturation protein CgeB